MASVLCPYGQHSPVPGPNTGLMSPDVHSQQVWANFISQGLHGKEQALAQGLSFPVSAMGLRSHLPMCICQSYHADVGFFLLTQWYRPDVGSSPSPTNALPASKMRTRGGWPATRSCRVRPLCLLCLGWFLPVWTCRSLKASPLARELDSTAYWREAHQSVCGHV